MAESTTIRWERDEDGIVILTLDDPNQSANTMNRAYAESMAATVDRLEAEKDEITGVVITSAKKTFFAGGDLNDLKTRDARTTRRAGRDGPRGQGAAAPPGDARQAGRARRSTAPRSAAAWRSAWPPTTASRSTTRSVQMGFPEVQLGLLPGAGGVVRTVRMLGIVDALMKLLMQGQRLRPAKAKEVGIVDEVVATREELVPAAKAWIKAQAASEEPTVQPWDVKGYKIPGGTPSNPKLAQNLPAFPANLRKQLKGANYPAPHHIMAAAVEGAQVDFDTAIEIEGRYFVDLLTGQVSKNMIQAFFFDLQQVNGDRDRPGGHRAVQGDEGRRARRRHDGRGDRLRVRESGHRGRAQGRLAGGRREGQGATRRGCSRRRSRAGARRRRRPTRCSPGSRRPTTRPRRRAPTS